MQPSFSYGKLSSVKVDNLTTLKQSMGWQIDQFNIPTIWKTTKGKGVKVAVLDSAIDIKHPDLKIKGGFDFVSNTSLSNIAPEIVHGTHVAGIIGAQNNNVGIVGVAPECDIYSCVVIDESGRGSFSNLIRAIDWCVSNKIDVINISLGAEWDDPDFYRAIRRAYDANIPVICASGNSAWERGYLDFPATYNETIAVSAINRSMSLADFSSIGPNIDVCAPGEDILSTIPGNSYAYMSGTSMATPFITGIVVLMIAKHRLIGGNTPINNVEDVRQHLLKMTMDLSYVGQDNYTGWGIINPNSALDFDAVLGSSVMATHSVKGVSSPYYKIRVTFSQDMNVSSIPNLASKYRKYISERAIPVKKGQAMDLLFTIDDIKRAVKTSKKYIG